MAAISTLTISQAADELGVAPARVRSLVASGAVPSLGSNLVSAEAVAELVRRGTLRSLDVAAVESALDRALRRRLPPLLDGALGPLSGEVATALADVEVGTRELAGAEQRAAAAEASLRQVRAELGTTRDELRVSAEALSEAHVERAGLRAELAVLQAKPAGLFRRRRQAGSPVTA